MSSSVVQFSQTARPSRCREICACPPSWAVIIDGVSDTPCPQASVTPTVYYDFDRQRRGNAEGSRPQPGDWPIRTACLQSPSNAIMQNRRAVAGRIVPAPRPGATKVARRRQRTQSPAIAAGREPDDSANRRRFTKSRERASRFSPPLAKSCPPDPSPPADRAHVRIANSRQAERPAKPRRRKAFMTESRQKPGLRFHRRVRNKRLIFAPSRES
jgi:hypothetical protein